MGGITPDTQQLAEQAAQAAERGAAVATVSAAGGAGSAAAIFLVQNATLIGALTGVVSIAGVTIGLIVNIYFKRRNLQLREREVQAVEQAAQQQN